MSRPTKVYPSVVYLRPFQQALPPPPRWFDNLGIGLGLGLAVLVVVAIAAELGRIP